MAIALLATVAGGVNAVASADAPHATHLALACEDAPTPPAGMAAAILDRTNADRAAAGLSALRWSPRLSCLAQDWARQLTQDETLHHRELERVLSSTEYGSFQTLGENLLRGRVDLSPAMVEDAWMRSPEHRANILDPDYTAMAVAILITPDGSKLYVVENFGG